MVVHCKKRVFVQGEIEATLYMTIKITARLRTQGIMTRSCFLYPNLGRDDALKVLVLLHGLQSKSGTWRCQRLVGVPVLRLCSSCLISWRYRYHDLSAAISRRDSWSIISFVGCGLRPSSHPNYRLGICASQITAASVKEWVWIPADRRSHACSNTTEISTSFERVSSNRTF